MKVFLVIICLVLFQITVSQGLQGVPGAWSIVAPEAFDNDPQIQDALNFGANTVLRRAIEAGDVNDVDYNIVRVFKVRKQVVVGQNYQFLAEAQGDDASVVTLSYIVYIQTDGTRRVLAWKVYVVKPGQDITNELGEVGEYEYSAEEVYLAEELAL